MTELQKRENEFIKMYKANENPFMSRKRLRERLQFKVRRSLIVERLETRFPFSADPFESAISDPFPPSDAFISSDPNQIDIGWAIDSMFGREWSQSSSIQSIDEQIGFASRSQPLAADSLTLSSNLSAVSFDASLLDTSLIYIAPVDQPILGVDEVLLSELPVSFQTSDLTDLSSLVQSSDVGIEITGDEVVLPVEFEIPEYFFSYVYPSDSSFQFVADSSASSFGYSVLPDLNRGDSILTPSPRSGVQSPTNERGGDPLGVNKIYVSSLSDSATRLLSYSERLQSSSPELEIHGVERIAIPLEGRIGSTHEASSNGNMGHTLSAVSSEYRLLEDLLNFDGLIVQVGSALVSEPQQKWVGVSPLPRTRTSNHAINFVELQGLNQVASIVPLGMLAIGDEQRSQHRPKMTQTAHEIMRFAMTETFVCVQPGYAEESPEAFASTSEYLPTEIEETRPITTAEWSATAILIFAGQIGIAYLPRKQPKQLFINFSPLRKQHT